MKQRSWMILLAAVILISCAGCARVKPNANESIIGTWSDAYGLTKYQFQPEGKMKIEALSLGSFKGTYQISDDQITIEYRVLVKDVKNTYQMRLEGNTLYLNDQPFIRKK